MLIKFFLWLNSLFKEAPHPFNQTHGGKQLLNYADFEFEHAAQVFALFNRFGIDGHASFEDFIKGKRIVDFACGGGGKSVYLAQSGAAAIVGLDTNPIFIEQAKEIAKRKGVVNRCTFLCESVTATSLQNNAYDIVILNDAIDHIDAPQQALAEALRILAPGGRVLINFESYFYFWGHHLWDAIRIPWLHLFTTENFRIKLYKAAVRQYPDADQRVQFRISKDENNVERITYLNHLTLRKFRKIVNHLKKHGLNKEHSYITFPRRLWMKLFACVPYVRELFISTILVVLKKEGMRMERAHRRPEKAIHPAQKTLQFS